jgi:hypothetical protein
MQPASLTCIYDEFLLFYGLQICCYPHSSDGDCCVLLLAEFLYPRELDRVSLYSILFLGEKRKREVLLVGENGKIQYPFLGGIVTHLPCLC